MCSSPVSEYTATKTLQALVTLEAEKMPAHQPSRLTAEVTALPYPMGRCVASVGEWHIESRHP